MTTRRRTAASVARQNLWRPFPCRRFNRPPSKKDEEDSEAVYTPEDSIPELPNSGETVVCTTCHTLNVPDVAFCRRCGAPIGFISTIGPLETAYAEGFAYRQAVQGRPKFIVVVGIWLIFFPVLVTMVAFSLSILKKGMEGTCGLVAIIGFFLSGFVSAWL